MKIAAAKLLLKDRSDDEDNEDGSSDDTNSGDTFSGSDAKSTKKRRN